MRRRNLLKSLISGVLSGHIIKRKPVSTDLTFTPKALYTANIAKPIVPYPDITSRDEQLKNLLFLNVIRPSDYIEISGIIVLDTTTIDTENT